MLFAAASAAAFAFVLTTFVHWTATLVSPRARAIRKARRRLQGKWRSDRERTISNWVFPKELAEDKVRNFHAMFGKMSWHFAGRVCHFESEGRASKGGYQILWADDWSAIVKFDGPDREKCYQLSFDGDHFYLAVGRPGNGEYFRRIEP